MIHSRPSPKASDLLSALKSSLPPATYGMLEAMAARAATASLPLYLVGGPVRDLLLGRSHPRDLDLVVEGDAATLAFEVAKELSGEVVSYTQFGTATIKINGQRFDLATARRESYPRPGMLPQVTPSTIQDDLWRRDFTINAMALPLWGPGAGALLDPTGGKEDLDEGLVRVLHDNSFRDDPTRILRALRYEQRWSFRLEEHTCRLLTQAVKQGFLGTVSGDRLRRELELIFQEPHPGLPLARCGQLGVLRALFPPLGHADLQALQQVPGGSQPLIYLAALVYQLSPAEAEALIARLQMSSQWAKIVRDVAACRAMEQRIRDAGVSNVSLRRLLDGLSPVSLQTAATLTLEAAVKERIDLYLDTLRHVKPALTGKDLLALGTPQGPLVGKVLQLLTEARLEGRVTTAEEETQLALRYLEEKGS